MRAKSVCEPRVHSLFFRAAWPHDGLAPILPPTPATCAPGADDNGTGTAAYATTVTSSPTLTWTQLLAIGPDAGTALAWATVARTRLVKMRRF